jgi:hypothetical protein
MLGQKAYHRTEASDLAKNVPRYRL